MTKLLLFCHLFLWGSLMMPVVAQDAEPQAPASRRMETDRPHVSEAAAVVGPGVVQVESGFLSEVADGKRPLYSLPVLLRVGLSETAELRLESDSMMLDHAHRGGARDLNLGAKVMLMEDESVSMAVLLRCGVYTSTEGFRTHLEPGAKLLLGAELSETLGFELNLGLTSVFDGDNTVTRIEPNFAVALTQSLDEHWSVFGEVFGEGVHGVPFQLYAQTGLMLAPGPDSQWDFEIIRGLSRGTQEWGFGFGYSRRF
jgi:hypothetical protein